MPETIQTSDPALLFYTIGMMVIWPIVCGYLAYKKNRSVRLWIVLGFLFSIVATVVIYYLPVAKKKWHLELNTGDEKKVDHYENHTNITVSIDQIINHIHHYQDDTPSQVECRHCGVAVSSKQENCTYCKSPLD